VLRDCYSLFPFPFFSFLIFCVLYTRMTSTTIYVYANNPDDSRYGNIIDRLLVLGYAPFVDTIRPAPVERIRDLCGFCFSLSSPTFLSGDDIYDYYVDAFIHFDPPLEPHAIEIAKSYFANPFGLSDYPRRIVTRNTSRLFKENYLLF
jgi:hypothetical protein